MSAEVLARHCDQIGRDPASIHRSTQALVMVTDDPAEARSFLEAARLGRRWPGPPEAFAERVAAWAAAGVDEVIVPDFTLSLATTASTARPAACRGRQRAVVPTLSEQRHRRMAHPRGTQRARSASGPRSPASTECAPSSSRLATGSRSLPSGALPCDVNVRAQVTPS